MIGLERRIKQEEERKQVKLYDENLQLGTEEKVGKVDFFRPKVAFA